MRRNEPSRLSVEFQRRRAAVRVGVVRGTAECRALVRLVIPHQTHATGASREGAHPVMLTRSDTPVGHPVARPAEGDVAEALRQLQQLEPSSFVQCVDERPVTSRAKSAHAAALRERLGAYEQRVERNRSNRCRCAFQKRTTINGRHNFPPTLAPEHDERRRVSSICGCFGSSRLFETVVLLGQVQYHFDSACCSQFRSQ